MSEWHETFNPEELARARQYSMLIQWSPEDETYIVTVPELPGLMTHGETHDQAVRMGEEAIALWLVGLHASGRSVPAPRVRVASA